jgi:hypothetical protein
MIASRIGTSSEALRLTHVAEAKREIERVLAKHSCKLHAFPRFVPAPDGGWRIHAMVEVVYEEQASHE